MTEKPKAAPEVKPPVLPDATCKCGGLYFSMMEGELRCTRCKGRSPKSRFNHKTQRFEKVAAR